MSEPEACLDCGLDVREGLCCCPACGELTCGQCLDEDFHVCLSDIFGDGFDVRAQAAPAERKAA